MALNLVKLCVGVASADELEEVIRSELADAHPQKPPHVAVTTRRMPKRLDELTGGSLFWIIKGSIAARQPLVDIRGFVDRQGVKRCCLVLEPTVFRTSWIKRKPFQGWRYLEAGDAPADLGAQEVAMPEGMRDDLLALGLI